MVRFLCFWSLESWRERYRYNKHKPFQNRYRRICRKMVNSSFLLSIFAAEIGYFHVDNAVYLFAPLRRYDVANLNQNAVRAVADLQLSEAATLGVNFFCPTTTISILNTAYWNGIIIRLGPIFLMRSEDSSNFNLWYEHANTDRDQRARQSNSDGTPATSPARDWFVSLWTDTIP